MRRRKVIRASKYLDTGKASAVWDNLARYRFYLCQSFWFEYSTSLSDSLQEIISLTVTDILLWWCYETYVTVRLLWLLTWSALDESLIMCLRYCSRDVCLTRIRSKQPSARWALGDRPSGLLAHAQEMFAPITLMKRPLMECQPEMIFTTRIFWAVQN